MFESSKIPWKCEYCDNDAVFWFMIFWNTPRRHPINEPKKHKKEVPICLSCFAVKAQGIRTEQRPRYWRNRQ